MFTANSCFQVQPGFKKKVKEAFRNRPKWVENYQGFIRLNVLSPTENAVEIWLLTNWESEQICKEWHRNGTGNL